MKLVIRKLWYPASVDDTAHALFEVPVIRERFDEGFVYAGEMRPRGIKICSGYWPAEALLRRMPDADEDVSLILTSMELQGDYGRIHGRGYQRKAIASSNGYTRFEGVFSPNDVGFQAMTTGEIGHALGLAHHAYDPSNPCEMSHNQLPGPRWTSLEEIRFCDDCSQHLDAAPNRNRATDTPDPTHPFKPASQ